MKSVVELVFCLLLLLLPAVSLHLYIGIFSFPPEPPAPAEHCTMRMPAFAINTKIRTCRQFNFWFSLCVFKASLKAGLSSRRARSKDCQRCSHRERFKALTTKAIFSKMTIMKPPQKSVLICVNQCLKNSVYSENSVAHFFVPWCLRGYFFIILQYFKWKNGQNVV